LQYKVERGSPLPQDNKNLRPSRKEIFDSTKDIEEEKEEEDKLAKGEINSQATRADALIKEGQELANKPRPATVSVSKPESYHNYDETEIVKKLKRAASDLKDIILSAATIAERKFKESREAEEERQVDIDAENISKMGGLATQFTNSFEDVLSEIRTRTYAEQEQIYMKCKSHLLHWLNRKVAITKLLLKSLKELIVCLPLTLLLRKYNENNN
jgi:multidrug efflux pump subunit AcrB